MTKRTSHGALFCFRFRLCFPDPEQTPQKRAQETGGMYNNDFHGRQPLFTILSRASPHDRVCGGRAVCASFRFFFGGARKKPAPTGKVYRVADQDTLTVEIPVTFGEDGYALLMICPEGSTDLTSNVYPLLIVLAAE